MLNYGMIKFSPHHKNSVLVQVWDSFKVYVRNIIRDRIMKKNLPPSIPPKFTTNNQACYASIQVYSGHKDEKINNISHHIVGTIEVQVTRDDNLMVVF